MRILLVAGGEGVDLVFGTDALGRTCFRRLAEADFDGLRLRQAAVAVVHGDGIGTRVARVVTVVLIREGVQYGFGIGESGACEEIQNQFSACRAIRRDGRNGCAVHTDGCSGDRDRAADSHKDGILCGIIRRVEFILQRVRHDARHAHRTARKVGGIRVQNRQAAVDDKQTAAFGLRFGDVDSKWQARQDGRGGLRDFGGITDDLLKDAVAVAVSGRAAGGRSPLHHKIAIGQSGQGGFVLCGRHFGVDQHLAVDACPVRVEHLHEHIRSRSGGQR